MASSAVDNSHSMAQQGLGSNRVSGEDFNSELSAFAGNPRSGEMGNSQLKDMLYAPLDACIKGMTMAAQNSVEFIKRMGFEPPANEDEKMGKPIMIHFELKRPGGALGMLDNKAKVTIPFLTLVHIPFLRLEKVVVDFTIKLNSIREQTVTGSRSHVGMNVSEESQEITAYDEGLLGDAPNWNKTTNMVGLTSTRLDSANGNEIKKEYSLQVVITAVQDALPVGMEKLLDILEQEIKDTSNDANATAMMGKMTEAGKGPELGTIEGMSTFQTGATQ